MATLVATGQTEDHLDGGLDRGAFPDVALDAQELRGTGEVRGERAGGTDPDAAPLGANGAGGLRPEDRLGVKLWSSAHSRGGEEPTLMRPSA